MAIAWSRAWAGTLAAALGTACRATAPPKPPQVPPAEVSSTAAAPGGPERALSRLGLSPLRESLLEGRGGREARRALEAYTAGEALLAVLLAQAALGEEPARTDRRELLAALSGAAGVEADPEGILPLAGLVSHELGKARRAFFEERFGAAVQACRRALLLDPGRAEAWRRLGSAHYALEDLAAAREAYRQALRLEPQDASLRAFIKERGWDP